MTNLSLKYILMCGGIFACTLIGFVAVFLDKIELADAAFALVPLYVMFLFIFPKTKRN